MTSRSLAKNKTGLGWCCSRHAVFRPTCFYVYFTSEIWYVRGFTYQLHFKMYLKCQRGLHLLFYFLEIRRGDLHFLKLWKNVYICATFGTQMQELTGAHIFVSNIWQGNSSCYKPTCFKQTRKNRCFRKLSVIEYLTLQWLQDIFFWPTVF